MADLTLNIVALLDEIAGAIAGSESKKQEGGDSFWQDLLHLMNINLVDLPLFAKIEVSLPLLRDILISAPLSAEQVKDPDWQKNSPCYEIIAEGDKLTANAAADTRADFEECRNYWLTEFPRLSDKTRGIVVLMFSMLARPLVTRPLRKLFSGKTNIKPEDTFEGKIIIIDLPVQEYRLAGRIANLTWKYCFQVAVLRRIKYGQKPSSLRPVFLWADEAQNFITKFDSEYQAVARSAGGCTVYLTQNRESYLRVLGNPSAVDSLLGNLQAKFFCQNTGDTNEYAAKLLGKRWSDTLSTSVSRSGEQTRDGGSSVTRGEQLKFYVDPARFTTLKRGGPAYNFQVQAIVFNGSHQFAPPPGSTEAALPYKLITFNQRDNPNE